jgi:hypothetical protein
MRFKYSGFMISVLILSSLLVSCASPMVATELAHPTETPQPSPTSTPEPIPTDTPVPTAEPPAPIPAFTLVTDETGSPVYASESVQVRLAATDGTDRQIYVQLNTGEGEWINPKITEVVAMNKTEVPLRADSFVPTEYGLVALYKGETKALIGFDGSTTPFDGTTTLIDGRRYGFNSQSGEFVPMITFHSDVRILQQWNSTNGGYEDMFDASGNILVADSFQRNPELDVDYAAFEGKLVAIIDAGGEVILSDQSGEAAVGPLIYRLADNGELVRSDTDYMTWLRRGPTMDGNEINAGDTPFRFFWDDKELGDWDVTLTNPTALAQFHLDCIRLYNRNHGNEGDQLIIPNLIATNLETGRVEQFPNARISAVNHFLAPQNPPSGRAFPFFLPIINDTSQAARRGFLYNPKTGELTHASTKSQAMTTEQALRELHEGLHLELQLLDEKPEAFLTDGPDYNIAYLESDVSDYLYLSNILLFGNSAGTGTVVWPYTFSFNPGN